MSRQAMAVAVVATFGLGGCATVGDRAGAAETIAVRMLTAVHADDGTAACALLAPDTAAEVAQSGTGPCAEAILDEGLPEPGTVTGTDVYGQWAQVRLTGDTVFLAAFPGGWRVVAAGCAPRPARPYDCALHGG